MIRATLSTRPAAILCFDLENRPLAYWYDGQTTAEITAIGWKWRHEENAHALLLRADGRFEDDHGKKIPVGRAYGLFKVLLSRADLVYGHNIRRHDLPLFNTGLIREGIGPLDPVRTTDTLRDYPKRKDMSASLENLARLYDLGGEKLHMGQADWEKANRLRPDGMAMARERVVSDVLLQERLRDRLLELGLLARPSWWKSRPRDSQVRE